MIRVKIGAISPASSMMTNDATATPPLAPPAAARLLGRTARSPNTVHGWVAVLFGLPFVGIGVALAAGLTGAVHAGRSIGRVGMPPLFFAPIAAIFAIAGLAAIASGIRDLVGRARMPALRARYVGQPWLWDYPWDRRGGRDESTGDIGRALSVAACFAIFLVPFHWIAFASPDRPIVFKLVTAIFDLVILTLVGRAVYRTLRLLRYGRSRIAFASFPFSPGTDAVIDLMALSPRARDHAIVATLRCVQERYETRRGGRNRQPVTVCYELCRDERTIAPGEPTVRFPIPADAPTTALGDRPPRYWELELRADGVPGVDYGARFLVPVY